jgi:hypothetical protein
LVVIKRKQIRSLNQKRRNFSITGGNCQTASKGQGIRDPPHSLCNKLLSSIFHLRRKAKTNARIDIVPASVKAGADEEAGAGSFLEAGCSLGMGVSAS